VQLGYLPLRRFGNRWPTGPLPLRLGAGHAGFDPLADERTLELSKGMPPLKAAAVGS
jgi:hypothetical protein